jgi:hypothetical protein
MWQLAYKSLSTGIGLNAQAARPTGDIVALRIFDLSEGGIEITNTYSLAVFAQESHAYIAINRADMRESIVFEVRDLAAVDAILDRRAHDALAELLEALRLELAV